MGDYPLYDGPEYDANEPDWDAMPVIVCAGCGETVYADFPGDLYCVPCAMTIQRESLPVTIEPLSRDFSEVPF